MPSKRKPKRRCQCADPGCPIHRGESKCTRAAKRKVRRIDMEDRSGTWMCEGCASDVYDSGLFNPGMLRPFYEVLVGNIGTVHKGSSKSVAEKVYKDYVSISKRGIGRAGGEDVSLWKDGEIIRDHYGTATESNPGVAQWIKAKAVRIRKVGKKLVADILTTRQYNPKWRGRDVYDTEKIYSIVPIVDSQGPGYHLYYEYTRLGRFKTRTHAKYEAERHERLSHAARQREA